jgi:hypothetical protein
MEREKMPQKSSYLQDSEVYALWKYLNGKFTEKENFRFYDLQGPNTTEWAVAEFISGLFDQLNIKLEKPVFLKQDFNWHRQFINDKNEVEIEKLLKILDSDFNVQELKDYNFSLGKYKMLECIEFSKNLSKKNRDKLTNYFDFYINQFIADNLINDGVNYFRFELQKQKTLELINDYKTKYGNKFFLEYKPTSGKLSPCIDPYLFVHSIIVLEKLGNIKVNEAWSYDEDLPEDEENPNKYFKIKITVIGPEVKKIKLKKFDPILKIEGNIGYFKFYKEGLKIEIGKVDTKKYRLLACLLNIPETAKTTDSVFEAIKKSKDESDPNLNDAYLSSNRKLELIKYTMKELQKIEGLTGKIKLEFFQGGRVVLLKFKS